MKKIYAAIVRVVSTIAFPFTGLILHGSQRVRVLMRYQDSILLQRTSVGNQKWGLPGGGKEKHESLLEAAQREVKEEVGIELDSTKLKLIGEKSIAAKGGWPVVHVTFFEANLSKKVAPKITRPLEILEARWWGVNSLPKSRSDSVGLVLALSKADVDAE